MSKKVPILIGLLFVALFVWLSLTSNVGVRYVVSRIDNIFYDIQLRIHIWTHPTAIKSPVVIVDVDDASLKALGRWPWPRSLLAKLVDRLKELGAVVVATDMMFSEPDVNIVSTVLNTLSTKKLITPALDSTLTQILPDFEQDGIFAHSLQGMDSVLGMVFLPGRQEEGLLPNSLLKLTLSQANELVIPELHGFISNVPILEQAAKSAGFLNVFPDLDGTIRRAPIVLRYQDEIYPSLAMEAVRRYLLITNIELFTPYYDKTMRLEGIKFGNYQIPTDEKGQVLIPFIGRSFVFPYISAITVLTGNLPPHFLDGKLIFLGTSATGGGDLKPTSIDKVFPGVEIQATVANGLFTHYFPYKPVWATGAELVFTLAMGLLAAFAFPYMGPVMVSVLILIIPVAFCGFIILEEWLWNATGFIFSILIPIMLITMLAIFNIVYGYLFEARKRKKLKGIFGQYVPKKHIDEMLKAKGNYGMLGDDRQMTVLFADIRNFTSISEGMKASELKEMLNAFFTPMTELIFKHKGTIDKYVGDLIMAFWGAPMKDKNHAHHALAAALDMQENIKNIASTFSSRGWPSIQMGIGLNSGMMSVGDMGSKFRRNYTVLGDEVNLASRVESLTKFYGVDIMTTEHTRLKQPAYVFRQLDRVRVKGKQTGINIYEVVTREKQLTPELQEELQQHHKALTCYFDKKFKDAFDLFTKLHYHYPERKIYTLYLERLSIFKETPPPMDWDGIFTHVTK